MDLAGKNVVYLGGFGGIGQKCVLELLRRQLKALAVFDFMENAELLSAWQAANPSTEIFHQKMDITKKADIEAAYKATVERIGHFDVVINGCGLMNDRLLELTIEINLLGVIHSSLIALEYMDKSQGGKGGVIANISSVVGLEPAGMMAIYSASKTGVTAFTRAMGNPIYYAKNGVSFITICPGFTKTTLLDDIDSKTTFTYETAFNERFKMIKPQDPEDCAANLVKATEQGQNGSVWLLENNELSLVDFPVMWKPTLK